MNSYCMGDGLDELLTEALGPGGDLLQRDCVMFIYLTLISPPSPIPSTRQLGTSRYSNKVC